MPQAGPVVVPLMLGFFSSMTVPKRARAERHLADLSRATPPGSDKRRPADREVTRCRPVTSSPLVDVGKERRLEAARDDARASPQNV
jgi:hypothetical protein